MNLKSLLANRWIRMLKEAASAWWNDQAPSKGAALAYYSMFSIAPLLFLIISIAGLFFGADAVRGMVFAQLQTALDTIWRVPEKEKEKEKQSGLWTFIRSRLLTFGMVLGLAFLVTISLVLSSALSALGKWWGPMFGQWETVAHLLDLVVNFGVLTVVFAAIYKLMPRASIQWRDVWVGA